MLRQGQLKISSNKIQKKEIFDTPKSNKLDKIDPCKTFVIRKLKWREEMNEALRKEFESPDDFLKDQSRIKINKLSLGPRYTQSNGKSEIIPHSIVGSVINFKKAMASADKSKKGKAQGGIKNNERSSSFNSITSSRFNTLVPNATLSNAKLKNQESGQFQKPISDDQILLYYKSVKERIAANCANKSKKVHSKHSAASFDSSSGDEFVKGNKDKNKKEVKNGWVESARVSADMISEISISPRRVKKCDESTESSILETKGGGRLSLKDLRLRLNNGFVGFIEKINKNRIEIDSKSSLPISLQTELGRQTLHLEKEKENEVNRDQLLRKVKKLCNKRESDLLARQSGYSSLEQSLIKITENKKGLTDKIGTYQWMATLRKPKNFSGERLSYYSTGDSHWYIIREVDHKIQELNIPALESVGSIKKASKLIINHKNRVLKIPEQGSETSSPFNIKTQAISKNSSAEAIKSLCGLRLNGTSLLEQEFSDLKQMKGKKLLYKHNFDIENKRDFNQNELADETYKSNYGGSLEFGNHTSYNPFAQSHHVSSLSQSNSNSFFGIPDLKRAEKIIWN